MRPGAPPPLFPELVSRRLAIIAPTAAAKACACCVAVSMAKGEASPSVELTGSASTARLSASAVRRESVLTSAAKGLHTARLMGKKAVRFTPGDRKIGLQQGLAAKHKLKQA